jgi:hypothetical protein
LFQPFLGAISPILIVSDIRFEIIYLAVGSRLEIIYLVVGSLELIAGGLKLKCKSLSGPSCLFEVCGSRASRPVNELKDGIPGPVHQIGFRTGVFSFKCIRNSGFQRRRILTRTYLKIIGCCRCAIKVE